MELVKELPEIFEEFAEQRQRSFLVMKEVKDKGIPVVGAYCTYFPSSIFQTWYSQRQPVMERKRCTN